MKNSRIEDENVDFMVDDDFDNWHSSIYIKNYSKENPILIFDDWDLPKSRICKYNDEENTNFDDWYFMKRSIYKQNGVNGGNINFVFQDAR